MKRYIHYLFLSLSFISCSNLTNSYEDAIPGQQGTITIIQKRPISATEESVVLGQYGKYRKYLDSSNYLVGISSSKASPVDAPTTKVYAGFADYRAETKSDYSLADCIKLNGDPFPSPFNTKSSLDCSDSVFGKSVTISIPKRSTKSSSYEGDDIELYAPKEIEILSPKIEDKANLLPLLYYDGLVIEWNEDPMNENGVIFILEWAGEVVVGQESPETVIRRTCIVKDNGATTLNSHMFDGIPDTAVCHLTILRGDIDLADIDGASYKVLVETHEFLSFILIREIQKNS